MPVDSQLEQFVAFLERNEVRATYKAMAEAAGVNPRRVGELLGERCHRASWVVAKNGHPTGYAESEKHPNLYLKSDVISNGDELIRRMRRERK